MAQNEAIWNSYWYLITVILLGLVGLSYVYPKQLWPIHSISLLPKELQPAFWFAIILCLSIPFWIDRVNFKIEFSGGWKTRITFAGALGALALTFPIQTDQYGDALFIRKSIDFTTANWSNNLILVPLNPDFLNTKVAIHTFYELNNFFTWISGAKGTSVTPIIEALFLATTSMAWMWFTALFLKDH